MGKSRKHSMIPQNQEEWDDLLENHTKVYTPYTNKELEDIFNGLKEGWKKSKNNGEAISSSKSEYRSKI